MIDQLEKLLGSEQRQRTLVLKELDELVERFGRDRQTEIVSYLDAPVYEPTPAEELTPKADGPCVVTLSTTGIVGRASAGGRRRSQFGRHDVLAASAEAGLNDTVLAVTSGGRIIATPISAIPEVSGRSRGASASEVFGTIRSEGVLTVVMAGSDHLVLVTALGTAKRVDLTEADKGRAVKQFIKLKPNDRVVAAFCAPESAEMVMVSTQSRVLRVPVESVPVQGRGASGVVGIKLRNGDRVIAADGVGGEEALIWADTAGVVDITPVTDIPLTARGGVGTQLAKENPLAMAVIAPRGELLAEVDDNGKPAKAPVPFSWENGDDGHPKILSVGMPRW